MAAPVRLVPSPLNYSRRPAWTYVWKRVPSTNGRFPGQLFVNIGNTMGRINSDTFDGILPYRLLCAAPDIQQMVGPTGLIEFEIKYPLAQRPLTPPASQAWNSKFRLTGPTIQPNPPPFQPGFYDIEIDPGSIPGLSGVVAGDPLLRPYQPAPFAKLFQNA